MSEAGARANGVGPHVSELRARGAGVTFALNGKT